MRAYVGRPGGGPGALNGHPLPKGAPGESCLTPRSQTAGPWGPRPTAERQGELFAPVDVEGVAGESIEERFARFHSRNPQVYRELRDLALHAVRRGRRRGSMKQLFEALRAESLLATEGEDWKLNNSYTALYARLLMACEPELEGWFETRRRVSAGAGEDAGWE